jgi:high-affinity nickel-transport protein
MSAKKLLFLLGVITLAVWLLNLTVTLGNVKLLSLVFIAFTLGLRHGFDADHIVAIDNITRKFNSENRKSYTTGLFFALGHSTIVFVLTLLILKLPYSLEIKILISKDY